MMTLRRYRRGDGRVPLSDWLENLESAVSGRVMAYVDRMKLGHFGKSRSVGQGVLELKMDFGPGYRVYYLRDGHTVVVLLCAGHKGTQRRDIQQAYEYAADYWRRR